MRKLFGERAILELLWPLTVASLIYGGWLGSGPYIVYRACILVALFLIALQLCLHKPFRLQVSAPARYALTFFGLWLVYAVASAIWALSAKDVARHSAFIATNGTIALLAVMVITTKERTYATISVVRLVYWTLLAFGLFEIATGLHSPGSAEYTGVLDNTASYVPTGPYTNRNDFSTVLTLFLPIVLYVPARVLPGWKGFLRDFLLILFGAFVILRTGSRANGLCLLVFVAVFLWQEIPRRFKYWVLSLGALALVVAGPKVIGHLLAQGALERLAAMGNPGTYSEGSSMGIRIALLQNGLRMLSNTYFFGVGAGNIEQNMRIYNRVFQSHHVNMHSLWMEVLASYGILTFIGLVALYASLLKGILGALRDRMDPLARRVSKAFFAGVLMFAINANASSSVIDFTPVWVYLALMIAWLNVANLPDPVGSPTRGTA